MNVIEDSGYSNGKLEDSFIKRVSSARTDIDALDNSKHEDENSSNKSQFREGKTLMIFPTSKLLPTKLICTFRMRFDSYWIFLL